VLVGCGGAGEWYGASGGDGKACGRIVRALKGEEAERYGE